jgi:hypothetical protein
MYLFFIVFFLLNNNIVGANKKIKEATGQVVEVVKNVLQDSNAGKLVAVAEKGIFNETFDINDAIDMVKEFTDGTPEGEIIQKVENLFGKNEIDKIRTELEKEYQVRLKEQTANKIIGEVVKFESLLIHIVNDYIEAIANIKIPTDFFVKKNDLKEVMGKFKSLIKAESIQESPFLLDFLIDLYCVVDQEDYIYKNYGYAMLKKNQLEEYYYKIENYIRL